MNWASLIQETLDLSGLTLTELAARVGMSKGQLHDLKSGHQRSCMYEAGVALVHQHRLAQRRKHKPTELHEGGTQMSAVVYRHFDAQGKLLYVGCSLELARRCLCGSAKQIGA